MSRVRSLGAALLIVAAVLVPAGHAPADEGEAATITEIGWWSRRPGATAPAGGFEVAKAPDGDLSTAALRILIAPGELTQALLVLKEGGGAGQDIAGMQTCVTSAVWTAAAPGAMSAAPKADCARAVKLQRDATTATWSADITALLRGLTTASVVIVPAEDAIPLPVDPGFQVQIGGAQLISSSSPASSTTSDSGPSSGSSGSGAIASEDSSTFEIASGDVFDTYVPSSTSTFGNLGVAPTLDPTPLPAAATISDNEAAGAANTTIDPSFQPAVAEPGKPKPWGKLAFLLPAALGIGALSTLSRKRLREVLAA